MNTKLQELTDKIYNEGVEKGKQEADKIVEAAKQEAQKILSAAEEKATEIVNNAQAKSNEITKNTESELKLYTTQSINALKTQVANMISGQIAQESVKAATANPEFMQSIIKNIAQSWVENGEVRIETAASAELENYFIANAKTILDKGVKITEVKGMKADFSISPAEGGYKVTFGEAEFTEYFKEFLRPKLIEMLF